MADRVCFTDAARSYAHFTIVKADRLIPVPDSVSTKVAAAVLLHGMTAHYLECATHPLMARDRCLVHSAAGGVGLLLVHIATRCEAFVIGTAPSDENADLATNACTHEMIVYSRDDFLECVLDITKG